jgi:hypothetical protein
MYGSLQLYGDEVACGTTVATASPFTDNTPDEAPSVRFSNYGATDETIYYLNSGDAQIGCIKLRAGESLLLHKRRTYHKFYASSAEIFGVAVFVMR